jgi:S-adenosylmethionine:tRNA ribosyltransferase-isomerase
MNSFEKISKQYDYSFPHELIAQSPASPRDSAKLLVYDRATRQINHDTYKNIAQYLPKNSVLVLNQTKVIPARLVVVKPTGGQARVLYIKTVGQNIAVLSDRKLEIGSAVTIPKTRLCFTVKARQEQFYILKPSFKISELYTVLNKYGQTPLPPYIKNSKLKAKKLLQEYNTVFAKTIGSVAAPTASLHFTQGLLNKIKRSGIKIVYVTLHVNLGTFAPLTEQQLKDKKLHTEYYEISKPAAATLNKAKKSGQQIIAVGTTVVRTLESAATSQNKISKLSGPTSLFITERTKLRFVDSIITNFHVPKSSLLMLVSSFISRQKLIALYKLAIQKKYRLFSFGDGMLIK